MKSKEKLRKYNINKNKRKKAKISIKNIIIFFISIIILLYLIIFYNYFFGKGEVLAKETSEEIENFNVKISNAEQINLDEIINENTLENSSEEYLKEEVDLEYITKYKSNPELPSGVIQVIQEGREGKQEVTTKRTYEKLPSEAHVIVNNAQTAIELGKSSKTGFITSKKMLTVSGEGLKENANVIVPIGCKVSQIIDYLGGYVIDDGVVLMGGPMCSRGLMNDECAVLPCNDAITVLRRLVRRTQTCLRCGACSDHCPANLQPVEIKIAFEHKDIDRMMALKPTSCIGCGLCSYVCPSHIEVNDFVKKAKNMVNMENAKRAAMEKNKQAALNGGNK